MSQAGRTAPSGWRRLRRVALALILGVVALAALTGFVVTNRLAAAFAEPLALGSARLRLVDVDHGLFRTRVHYALAWPLGNGEQARLVLEQRIDHGPWPLQRLASGRWAAAVLASQLRVTDAVLARDGATRALPLQIMAELSLGYTGVIDASVRIDAPDLPLGPVSLVLDKLDLTARYALAGNELEATLGADGLAVRQGGEASVQLLMLRHTLSAQLTEEYPALAGHGSARTLVMWGQPIGSVHQVLDLQGLNVAALGAALQGQKTAWPRALPPAATLTGELLGVRHPEGVVSLSVQRAAQTPGLRVLFVLPRAVVRAAVAAPAALAALGPPGGSLARQQADMAYALMSGQLLNTGLVQSSPSGLVADLALSADGVVVNGEAHDWPRFHRRFFPAAEEPAR